MQTRHAVLLLTLLGAFGAAALAIAAHRTRLTLELAQRAGGEDARNAIQASSRFSQVQELGFLALALILLALFLLHMSLKSERSEAPRFTPRAEPAPKFVAPPIVEAPQIAEVVPSPAPAIAEVELAPVASKEEPHA